MAKSPLRRTVLALYADTEYFHDLLRMRRPGFFVPAIVALLAIRMCFATVQYESSSSEAILADVLTREAAVEEYYRNYERRLNGYQKALANALKETGADAGILSADRNAAALERAPALRVADGPVRASSGFSYSRVYSWPATETLIAAELDAIADMDAELRSADNLGFRARRSVYQRLAAGYQALRGGQENIAAHIRYNRFWQRMIAMRRPEYDRETALYNAAVKRDVLDRLAQALGKVARPRIAGIAAALGFDLSDLAKQFRDKANSIDRELEKQTETPEPPSFVRLERRSEHGWVLHVPFSTDIRDPRYIGLFKTAIEKIWHVRDGADEFSVKLGFSILAPAGTRRSGEPSLEHRLESVGSETAFLTTGGTVTYAQGTAIVLGSEAVSPKVLAHEFGHVLGFRDNYFRGYRDIGTDGIEIMEADANPQDIMGAPETGNVSKAHFRRLIAALQSTETAAHYD